MKKMSSKIKPMHMHAAIFIMTIFFGYVVNSYARMLNMESQSDILHLSMAADNKLVIIDNEIFQVNFTSPEGHVSGIKYNGFNNLLDPSIEIRGYWDLYWHPGGQMGGVDLFEGTQFKIVTQNEDQIEVSFSRLWNSNSNDNSHPLPLNIDKRYIIRKGVSGIYMYSILERLQDWPEVSMDQIRTVFKLENRFNSMAISDDKQRIMPTGEDRNTQDGRAEQLDYKEAVRLINPENPALKGEVDDKYEYSIEHQDDQVHGWMSNDASTGFWIITPSNEYRDGGPIKQELTLHAGPICLATFTSVHYVGTEMETKYLQGETWKKVLGPVFVYFNSQTSGGNRSSLWDDAKRQMNVEVQSWPYDFPESEDFPPTHQRGNVTGQLNVKDLYSSQVDKAAQYAHVGLAAPGDIGSWQRDVKGYQFWTRTDEKGNFKIENVRAGSYSLYGWVPGFIGEYKYEKDISIAPGSNIELGPIVYEPPRKGPTVWEIGVPDRTAAEYYIPDPDPDFVNKLFLNHTNDKFRQYGLWNRYAEIYPKNDLVFTVGTSDYKKDWFFAHVVREVGNGTYAATTWQIKFKLDSVKNKGSYNLQLAIASHNSADLQVWFNSIKPVPDFSETLNGTDNAIARHGIHGCYLLVSIPVPSTSLQPGENTIYLKQPRNLERFLGLMYDYIRLEGPSG